MEQPHSANEIADSSDWLGTSLPAFAQLESSLRCQVCKDFYDTPMITTCSHTFCSLCIRRCLSNDGKCPTCRSGDQAIKLRRNWTVQEVVDAFTGARQTALDLALESQKAQATQNEGEVRKKGKKRKRDAIEDVQASQEGRQTRSSARQAEQKKQAAVIAVDTDSEDEIFEPDGKETDADEAEDGLVPCPICGARMKEELVFGHLDKCDGKPPAPVRENQKKPSSAFLDTNRTTPQAGQRSSATPPTPSRIPQLNYSILKDGALRKKLKELGIPDWGPRQLLIKRHTEWVDIYNSNSDSTRPKPVRALLQDLKNWERTQGGDAPNNAFTNATPANNSVMTKDFDADDWKDKHKDQFGGLIAQARAKVKEQREKAEAEAAKEAQQKAAAGDSATAINGVDAGAEPASAAALTAVQESSEPTPMDVDVPIAPGKAAGAGSTEPVIAQSFSTNIPPSLSQQSSSEVPHHPRRPSIPINPSYSNTPSRRLSLSDRQDLKTLSPVAGLFSAAAESISEEDEPPISGQTTSNGTPISSLRKMSSAGTSPERARKVPMFQMPQHSVSDFDAAGGRQ